MTKKLRRYIFTGVIFLIIAAVISGYLMWNKPHRDVENADAIRISADSLYNTFINDSLKAKQIYLNHIVEVRGLIGSVSLNNKKQYIAFLKTAIPGASVNCTMEGDIKKYQAGDSIQIKGICSGYLAGDADMQLPGDVFITRGYVSK